MRINTKEIISTIGVAILVLVISYSGVYKVAGIKFYPPIMIAIAGFFYLVANKKISKFLFLEVVLACLVLFFSSLSSFFSEHPDSVYFILRYIIKAFFIPVFCCVVIRVILEKNINLGKNFFLNSVSIALFFQLSIIVLQMTSPAFRQLFFEYVELSDNWKNLANIGHFRATGLSGLSIYDTSVSYALFMIPLMGWCTSKNRIENNKYLFTSFVVATLTLLAGRTGFIMFFVFFLISILYSGRRGYFVFSLFLLLSIVLIMIVSIFGFDDLYHFSRFAFEPLYAFFETGSFRSASTDELMDSYLFVPWDTPMLTGYGVWAQPSVSEAISFKYMTDSGLILFYIFMGIPGLILILSYLSIFIYRFFTISRLILNEKHIMKGKAKLGKESIQILLFVFFVFFVFSLIIKAPFVFSERIMSVYFVIVTYCLVVFRRKTNCVDGESDE